MVVHDVLGLDVSVDYPFRVEIIDNRAHLSDELAPVIGCLSPRGMIASVLYQLADAAFVQSEEQLERPPNTEVLVCLEVNNVVLRVSVD
jgi:hypothetical protein